ncbi:hypothetical protein [Lunatibacter salilacus]|uniref:hypothetical protein n=1 Tax=Lunatibacter salilacus TaxID=2483804 RepID=UPI00131DFADA|nr:hypothetical protein [Lunatibacter salilacus]
MENFAQVKLLLVVICMVMFSSCGNDEEEPIVCPVSHEIGQELSDLVKDIGYAQIAFAMDSNRPKCLAVSNAYNKFIDRITSLELCMSEEEFDGFRYLIDTGKNFGTTCSSFQ